MDKGKTIAIERGYYKIGTCDKDGNIITPAEWVNDGESNAIAIGEMDIAGNVNHAQLFSSFQMDMVVENIRGLLNMPKNRDEVDYCAILKAMENDGYDVCEYCNANEFACRECRMKEGWRAND